jgi:citronellol/citronellal dehydrogenase
MSNVKAPLAGRTILMSGGSRGIGLAIALRAARDGANVAILAKTDTPHPKLPGTIHTAAAEIEAAGGNALAIVGDVRDEASITSAVSQTAETFGSIDIVVNNASAIDLSNSVDLSTKKFDLMQQIEVRGTFLLSRSAIPHLRESDHAHILTLSPPLNLAKHWMGANVGYMLAKYGMTLAALGLAAELEADGVASNTLWPRTIIATAAISNVIAADGQTVTCRTPEIMADAAYAIISAPPAQRTGQQLIDEDVLEGVDLSQYGPADAMVDLFVD